MKRFVFAFIIAIFSAYCSNAYAAKCNHDRVTALCNGCDASVNWKMTKRSKKEEKRWCNFTLRWSGELNGFTIVKGFSLGEIKTGNYWVAVSPFKTGRDAVTVQFSGKNRHGQLHKSTVTFNIEVVEGEF